MLQGVSRPVWRVPDMIDCDCQGSQLGVSLRRAPNKGLHRPLVTLAGFVCLGPASKARRETLAFLISRPGPVLAQDAWSLSSERHGERRQQGGTGALKNTNTGKHTDMCKKHIHAGQTCTHEYISVTTCTHTTHNTLPVVRSFTSYTHNLLWSPFPKRWIKT